MNPFIFCVQSDAGYVQYGLLTAQAGSDAREKILAWLKATGKPDNTKFTLQGVHSKTFQADVFTLDKEL